MEHDQRAGDRPLHRYPGNEPAHSESQGRQLHLQWNDRVGDRQLGLWVPPRRLLARLLHPFGQRLDHVQLEDVEDFLPAAVLDGEDDVNLCVGEVLWGFPGEGAGGGDLHHLWSRSEGYTGRRLFRLHPDVGTGIPCRDGVGGRGSRSQRSS